MALEDIILIVLLVIFEAILWIIPKTRTPNGNILIAFKTFPIGAIICIFSSWLIRGVINYFSELHMENIQIPRWAAYGAPLFSAIAAIIWSGIFIKRRWGTEKKYNPLPSLGCFAVMIIPLGILSFLLSLLTLGSRVNCSDWRTEWLNIGTEEKIAFENQSISPFLAEYNYRLRFVRNGKSYRQWLFVNTGGRTHFNIYRLADGRFLFREKYWDYLVDDGKMQVYRLANFEGKLYAALIPNEYVNSWGGPEKAGDKTVMSFNHHEVPAIDVTGIFDNMKYCGCIKDRFYSPQERPESVIDHYQVR